MVVVVVHLTCVSCFAGVRGKLAWLICMVGAGVGIIRVAIVASILLEKSRAGIRPSLILKIKEELFRVLALYKSAGRFNPSFLSYRNLDKAGLVVLLFPDLTSRILELQRA